MAAEQTMAGELARSWGYTASEGFKDAAQFLGALPADAWDGPTGASEWNMRALADHITGEAVWFPNLVHGVTRGEEPLPGELYEEMKSWPTDRLIAALDQAGEDLRSAIDEIGPAHLEQTVDLGFTQVPLWRATYISLVEGVFHDWDAHAGREEEPSVPTAWALELARGIDWLAPLIAHRTAALTAPGRYAIHVGDGVGAVSVTVQDGNVSLQPGEVEGADVSLSLSAEQYVRLIVGRLNLERALERGEASVVGDRARAMQLKRIFGGIANGD